MAQELDQRWSVSKGKQDISQDHHDEVWRLGDSLRGGWKGYEGRELGSMFSSLTPVRHLSWGGSLPSAPPVRQAAGAHGYQMQTEDLGHAT